MAADATFLGMTTRAGAKFDSTDWSMVLHARVDSARRQSALEKLCAAYWLPLYGYLRRQGNGPADAEDLTQAFLAYLISSDFLDRPSPEKGRFRGYLIGALKHFLSHHFERHQALKRGGGVRFIEWAALDAESEFAAVDQPGLDSSQAYERSWALTLLGRALKRLETEQRDCGKLRQFETLREFLSVKPTRGDYERVGQQLGAAKGTVAVWIHRLSQRYAELVKLEVAATVRDPAEVPSELRHLVQALR